MLVRICENCQPASVTLQEFLVKRTVESARFGRSGIIFHLDVETIMLKFKDREAAQKFSSMVNGIRYENLSGE